MNNPYLLGLKPEMMEAYDRPKTLRRAYEIAGYNMNRFDDFKASYYRVKKVTSKDVDIKDMLKWINERIFENQDPRKFRPKGKKTIPNFRFDIPKQKQRDGGEWFDVNKAVAKVFHQSRFAKKYKSLADFCTFAPQAEVEELSKANSVVA